MYQSTFISLLLQFALFSFSLAAPLAEGTLSTSSHSNPWKYGASGGVLGFIVLVLDIIVWLEVINSNRQVSHKLLWCVVVFLFPVLGLIFYWLFSNREAHAGDSGYEAIP